MDLFYVNVDFICKENKFTSVTDLIEIGHNVENKTCNG